MTIAALVYIGSERVQRVKGIEAKRDEFAADLALAFAEGHEAFAFPGIDWNLVVPLRQIEFVLLVDEKVADDGEEG